MSKQDHTAFPSVVVPPEGWTLHHEKWGFMGRDSSPGGRLVRLADVLQHIELSQAVSRADALTALADGLREDEGRSVFILRPGESPRQLAKNDRFGFAVQAPQTWSTQSSWVHQHASSEWLTRDAPARHAATAPTKPNQAVRTSLDWLVERMNKDLIAKGRGRALVSLDDETKQAARFAVLMNRAHELWGYGTQLILSPGKGWTLDDDERGHMRASESPNDCLVGILDVLEWFKGTRGLPAQDAAQRMAEGISPDMMGDVFITAPGKYAAPAIDRCAFGFMSAEFRQAMLKRFNDHQTCGVSVVHSFESAGQAWEFLTAQSVEAFYVDPVPPPGAESLRSALLLDALLPPYAVTRADVPRCKHVAVRLSCAHSLWGYGEPSDQPATIAATADGQQPGQAQALPLAPALESTNTTEWTGVQLVALREKLQKEGVKAYTQEMVKRTGLKEREIRRRINPAQPKKMAASPFDGLKSVTTRPKGRAA